MSSLAKFINKKESNEKENQINIINKSTISIFFRKGCLINITIKDPSIDNGYWEFKNFRFNKKLDLIGNGTYGNVYLSYNKLDNKPYAIKLIEKQKLTELECPIEFIYREISNQIQINHPNIIRLYSYHEDEGNIYMILEYSNRGSLFTKIRKKSYLSENETFSYFIQVINGINFLHDNNFIHRDIKPENILLDDKNYIKLCDFGWCVKLEENEMRNTICGTYEYMSPELVNNKQYNYNVDIWALGILLYEMIHGKSPFKPKEKYDNKETEKDEIFNNIINLNFEIDNSKNLSFECIDLINILLRKKSDSLDFKVKNIYEHCWVKKFENEKKKKLMKLAEEQGKKRNFENTPKKTMSLNFNKLNSVSNDNKLMKDLKNIISEKKLKSDIKIIIKKPEIKINKEKIKKFITKNQVIPRHFASNSTVTHDIINDDNTLKKREEGSIKRVFSNKSIRQNKIILKNVDEKKSFWDRFFG